MPEVDRQQAMGQRVAFRADAAFARPAIYGALESTARERCPRNAPAPGGFRPVRPQCEPR